MQNSKETHSTVKTLIQRFNDLNCLPEDQQSLQTSLEKANLLFQLFQHSKKLQEQDYFLMQAISLLEALSINAFNNDDNATQPLDNVQSTQKIDQKTYQQIQMKLATCYMSLAQLKNENKFYDIAKKLIKPYTQHNDPHILVEMIRVCAYKNEPSLCQFYIKKLIKLTDSPSELLDSIHALQKFKQEVWYLNILAN